MYYFCQNVSTFKGCIESSMKNWASSRLEHAQKWKFEHRACSIIKNWLRTGLFRARACSGATLLTLVHFVNFSLQKCKNHKKSKFRASKCAKMVDFELLFWGLKYCLYLGHCISKEIVVGPDYYSRSLMLCVLARKAASASFGKVSTTDVRLVDGHFAAPFAFGGRWPTPLYSLKKRP